MHLGFAMCDTSIVTVVLCFKVSLCQIIKTSFNLYNRVEDEGKVNGIHFNVAAK